MKPEDFSLVEFNARRYRLVPEFDRRPYGEPRCVGCTFLPMSGPKCSKFLEATNFACHGDDPLIVIDESEFNEYVAEWVRRRIS